MISTVITIVDRIKVKNQKKTKTGVGYVVKEKIGELEDIISEERIRRISKEVVVFFQAVVGTKKFLVQLEYFQRKKITSSLLLFLSSKEEVAKDEPLSHSPKKEQGKLLTIVGDLETISQKGAHRHTILSLSIGPTDATINRCYFSRYSGDVLAYGVVPAPDGTIYLVDINGNRVLGSI